MRERERQREGHNTEFNNVKYSLHNIPKGRLKTIQKNYLVMLERERERGSKKERSLDTFMGKRHADV